MRQQEKLAEKGVFRMAFLARIELMWNGLSFQWFALLQPSTGFSNVFHYNPINLAQGRTCIEKRH